MLTVGFVPGLASAIIGIRHPFSNSCGVGGGITTEILTFDVNSFYES